jgi:hypothetical protein
MLIFEKMGRRPYYLLDRGIQLRETGRRVFHGELIDATKEEP